MPCNNDLLAGNFVDNGERVWMIDYEYSGNNDPCFELGNIWGECGLSTEQLDELVTLYYGRPLRHKTARARLQGIVAKYGWTLWGCIQNGSSANGFRLLGLGDAERVSSPRCGGTEFRESATVRPALSISRSRQHDNDSLDGEGHADCYESTITTLTRRNTCPPIAAGARPDRHHRRAASSAPASPIT